MGKYFDEWAIGERIAHKKRHVVVEADDVEIKSVSYLFQTAGHDIRQFEAQLGRMAVDSTFVLAITLGVPVTEALLSVDFSTMGYDNLALPRPVLVGDVLRVETHVVAMQPSNSRPDAGIITFSHVARNQDGDVVCQCWRIAEFKGRDDSKRELILPDFLKRRVPVSVARDSGGPRDPSRGGDHAVRD